MSDGEEKHNEDIKESGMWNWNHAMVVAFLTFVIASGGWYGNFYVGYGPPQHASSTVSVLAPGFDETTHVVTRVVDADTVIVDNKHKVRLIGVDAPEQDGCYYQESVAYMNQLVMGEEVLLRKDSNAKDSLDRLLRYVFVYNPDPEKDHVFVNKLLLQDGMGELSFRGENRLHADIMQVSYGKARSAKRGLHGACESDEEKILEQPSKRHVIKGNHQIDRSTKIYYLPGCVNYSNIVMKVREGDQYFETEEEAVEAGFVKATNCKVEFEPIEIKSFEDLKI